MPTRPKKSVRPPPKTQRKIAAKGGTAKSKVKRQRLAETGNTTRVRAHVSSRGKRAQARRDAR